MKLGEAIRLELLLLQDIMLQSHVYQMTVYFNEHPDSLDMDWPSVHLQGVSIASNLSMLLAHEYRTKVLIFASKYSDVAIEDIVKNCKGQCDIYHEDQLSDKALLRLDTHVFRYSIYENGTGYIWESYSIPNSSESRIPVSRKIGQWHLENGIAWLHHGSIWDRRKDLRGMVLQVATLQSGTKVVDLNKTTNAFHGPFIDLLRLLEEDLNFTATIAPSRDGFWGSETSNGTWNGLVGMLVDGVVDVAWAPLTFNLERSLVIQCSPILEQLKIGFAIKPVGNRDKLDMFSVLEIFTWKSWISITLLLILFILILWAYLSFYSKGQHKSPEEPFAIVLNASIRLSIPTSLEDHKTSIKALLFIISLSCGALITGVSCSIALSVIPFILSLS